MVFSSTQTINQDGFYFIRRHLLSVALGLGALGAGMLIDYRRLKGMATGILVAAALLLLMVYLPGVGVRAGGASRWLNLGILSFQPSEFAKFAVILFLASALTDRGREIRQPGKGLLPILLVIAVVTALVMKQPDMGTAIVIAVLSLVLLFIGGINLGYIFFLLISGVIGFALLSITSPYRYRRLLAYLNPWKDPQDMGFQIIQSLLAVGSGGVFGLGLGKSYQKFFYLPQRHTDFIFAIIGEELGFIGSAAVVFLFLLVVVRGVRIVQETADPFGQLLGTGIVCWLAAQSLMNLGVVLGLLPTTGIPLPFISFGGTSIIVLLFSAGILLNLSRRRIAR